MTIKDIPCYVCAHFTPKCGSWTCDAFPEGVPDSIILDGLDHKTPIDGDNGILFEEGNPKVAKMYDKSSFSDTQRKALWHSFDAKAARHENGYKNVIKDTAKEQRNEFKQAIKNSNEPIDKRVMSAFSKVFDKSADTKLRDKMTPAWMMSMTEGYNHAKEVLGDMKTVKDVSTVNHLFRAWVKQNGLLRAEGINDTTNDRLRYKIANSLAEGIDSGEGLTNLINRILQATDETYDEMDLARATLIARTESVATVNFGSFATYKSEGVTKKEWLSTKDDRVRESHDEADGQIVGIDEDFEVGGDRMIAPGLGSDASENCNCRCTLLPVMEE